jgi:hypothetical protein
MITERELQQLGEARRHRGVRPLAEIEARVAQRRTRRIAGVGVSGLVVAAVAVAAFTVGPLAGSRTRAEPVPPATRVAPTPSTQKADCTGSIGYLKTYSGHPELLYLPPASVAGPIKGSLLVQNRVTTCPDDPVVIRYALKGGVVTAGMIIKGPNAQNEYAPAPGFVAGGHRAVAVIGGVTAKVQVFIGLDTYPTTYAFWTAKDGSSWSVRDYAPSLADALKSIRAITGPGGALDPAAVPPGFTGTITRPDSVSTSPSREGVSVNTTFSSVAAGGLLVMIAGGNEWQLGASYGSHLEQVDGRPAWWQPKSQGLTWTTADGVTLFLGAGDDRARLTLSRALAIARATVPVRPDNPRLKAAGVAPDAPG